MRCISRLNLCVGRRGASRLKYMSILKRDRFGPSLEHESRQNDARNNSIEDNVPYIFMRQLHVGALSLGATCATRTVLR